MQRRVRFVDDVSESTSSVIPAGGEHDHVRLASILDTLLAEHALQQQQQQQQQLPFYDSGQRAKEPIVASKPPPLEIAVDMSQGDEDTPAASAARSSPSDSRRSAVHSPHPHPRERTATPPSPVLSANEADRSGIMQAAAPADARHLAATHMSGAVSTPSPSPSVSVRPLQVRSLAEDTHGGSRADVLLVASPATLSLAGESSVAGRPLAQVALVRSSPPAPFQATPAVAPSVTKVGDVSRERLVRAEEPWRAQASENVHRLLRSSERQVTELLALKPALEASEKVRRDLASKLRAAQEEATEARLCLLREQTTQRDATSTLSRENLSMQSTIQRLQREKCQLEDALRKAHEAAAEQTRRHQAAMEAAQRRASEDKKYLDEARRTCKDAKQLEGERDHWQRVCSRTAEELAQARSENARLEAKLFELQRRGSFARGRGAVSALDGAPTSTGVNADEDDAVNAREPGSSVVTSEAPPRAWQEDHVDFLRDHIARLENDLKRKNEAIESAQACAAQAQSAVVEADGAREELALRLRTLAMSLDDEREQRQTAVEERDATKDLLRRAWATFGEDVLDALTRVSSDVPFDEAVTSLTDAARATLDAFARHTTPSSLSASSTELARLQEVLTRAVHGVMSGVKEALRTQAQALAEARQSGSHSAQRAEAIQQQCDEAARRVQSAEKAAQKAAAARQEAAQELHALGALSAKYEVLVSNALREYGGGRAGARLAGSRRHHGGRRVSIDQASHTRTKSTESARTSASDEASGRAADREGQLDSPLSSAHIPSSVAHTTDDDGYDASPLTSAKGSRTGTANPAKPQTRDRPATTNAPVSTAAQWQRHYQQLLQLLACVRRTSQSQQMQLTTAHATAATLTQRLQSLEALKEAAEKRLQDAHEKHKVAHVKHAAQLTAAAQQAEAREAALKVDVETAQRQAREAESACRVLREEAARVESNRTRAEAAAQTASTALHAKDDEIESLVELLENAKKELLAQRAASGEQAAKNSALRAMLTRQTHGAERVYQLLTAWVRFCVLLLTRLDRLGATHTVWRQLFWVSGSDRQREEEPLSGDVPQDSALTALSDVLTHVEWVREKPDKETAGEHGDDPETSLWLLKLPDSVEAGFAAGVNTPQALMRASPSSTPPPPSHQPSHRRHHTHTSFRAVVLAIVAVRRIVWLTRWHRCVQAEADARLPRSDNSAEVVDDVSSRPSASHARTHGAAQITRGPRVVFFEDEARAGRRSASAIPTEPSIDKLGDRTSPHTSGIASFLSPRLVRQLVLGARDLVLPQVDMPPLSELLTALERLHVESHSSDVTHQSTSGTTGTWDSDPDASAAHAHSHRDRSASPLPVYVLVEYLLHRVRLCVDESGVNAYCERAYGLTRGGADQLFRLPSGIAPACTRRQRAAAVGHHVASVRATVEAVVPHVQRLLYLSVQTQQILTGRLARFSRDWSELVAQNAQLGHALESQESAYDGIEASVEELERLLRERPAPEEMHALREQLVASQKALEAEREARRHTESRVADQTEKEMRLMQLVQQLRNQNRLLHVEVSRRGVTTTDLDRLQAALFRQPPPPAAPSPSVALSAAESSQREQRPLTPSSLFAHSVVGDVARHPHPLGSGDSLNNSKGPAPSTVPCYSEEDEGNTSGTHRTHEGTVDETDEPRPRRERPHMWGASVTDEPGGEAHVSRYAHGQYQTSSPSTLARAALGDLANAYVTHSPHAAAVPPLRTCLNDNPAGVWSADTVVEKHPLALYEPVTVQVAPSQSARTSLTAPSTTASTRTSPRAESVAVATGGASSSAPRVHNAQRGNRRAAPVLDLKARF